MNVYFREEQQFRQPWVLAILVLPCVLALHGAYRQLAMGRSVSAAFAIPVAFVIWFLSLKLVTEVREAELYVKFVRGWRARRIPLNGIRRATAITYNPILDYGGWGIRYGRNGMAYNVTGNRGVLLELTNCKNVLVGSQRPEDLARSIEERRALLKAG